MFLYRPPSETLAALDCCHCWLSIASPVPHWMYGSLHWLTSAEAQSTAQKNICADRIFWKLVALPALVWNLVAFQTKVPCASLKIQQNVAAQNMPSHSSAKCQKCLFRQVLSYINRDLILLYVNMVVYRWQKTELSRRKRFPSKGLVFECSKSLYLWHSSKPQRFNSFSQYVFKSWCKFTS